MPRQRKQKAKAVVLPPELDDDDEEAGSVIPDDDGWIALEGEHGDVEASGRDPGDSDSGKAKRVAGRANKRPKGTRRRNT